ncbi:FAD-dependent oxidoreductase [Methylorubrum zatmanii]
MAVGEIRIGIGDIPLGGMAEGKDGETSVLFVRDAAGIRAFQPKCPHYGAPLAKGMLCGQRLYCPWHKAAFSIGDGALLEPPALEGLKRYPVRIEGEEAVARLEPVEAETPERSSAIRHLVVVGTGAAAVAAVTTLRREGFSGEITMIGREGHPPYDRTMLSKTFLAKPTPPEKALLEQDFYAAHAVDAVRGSATRIDPAGRSVTLEDGRTISGDALLIATGSRAVLPDFPGADLDGAVTLRSLDDAVALSERAQKAARIVVVGGGFIGLEAAAFLTKRGRAVTVLAREEWPLAKRFGEAVARGLKRFHEGKGVGFRQGEVGRIVGDGTVTGIELKDGGRLDADLVLIGAGAAPESGMIDGVEPREDGGLAVGSDLALAPQVWIAGDIAAFPEHGSGSRARIEHWRLAQQHGMHVARAILGEAKPFRDAPFFWSNQGEKRLDYGGYAPGFDRIVMRGNPDELDFIAFYVKEDRAVAACSIGRNAEFTAFLHLLGEGRLPSPADLDRGVELTGLL